MRRTSYAPASWLWEALLLAGLWLTAGIGADLEKPLHRNHTTNLHPRFQTGNKRAVKDHLLVLFSITSSPQRSHLRAAGAWPLPALSAIN